MIRRARGPHGFTLLELLQVTAGLALLAAISVPLFSVAMARARTNGGAEALGAAIRDARMRAVATGWQYQVIALDSTGAVPNAFRIQAMDPNNGGAFPASTDTSPPAFYGPNTMHEAYTDFAREFGGIPQITVPGGVFTVTFDATGQWPAAAPCVPAPCQVQVSSGGRVATVNVSAAGAVLIQLFQ